MTSFRNAADRIKLSRQLSHSAVGFTMHHDSDVPIFGVGDPVRISRTGEITNIKGISSEGYILEGYPESFFSGENIGPINK